MDLVELAAAFKHARLEHNLTQRDIARITGIGLTTIASFEQGSGSILSVVKLLSLCDAVGLELLARERGHAPTLDELAREFDAEAPLAPVRQRARGGKVERGNLA